MPNTCCDLHLHSYYSDGRASPAEIIHHAAGLGLSTIAITDHDTVSGLAEAERVCRRSGIELIPAVELSASWIAVSREIDGESIADFDPPADPAGASNCPECIDLLGYGIEAGHTGLAALLAAARDDLRRRVELCCRLLSEDGWPVSLGDVIAENPRYPGPTLLLRALWHKGYAPAIDQVFSRFARAWQQCPPPELGVQEAIAAIHAASGAAVLAHPVSLHLSGEPAGAAEIGELKALGLDGIEVWHPRIDEAARQRLSEVAQRFALVTTGGSDEHGWPVGFPRMGSQLLPYTTIMELQKKIARISSGI